MEQLKRINLEKGTFEAGGKTYTIEKGLSLERYVEHTVLEKELAFGTTLKGIFDKLMGLREHLNGAKFVDSAVVLDDILRGIARVEEREPTIYRICALFMNTPDEDRATINEDMITEKITAWKAEGLDVRDFFTVALNSVSGYFGIYETITQTITNLAANQNQATQQK